MHTSIVLLVAAVLFGGYCCSAASLGDLVDPSAANAAIGDAAAKANYYLPTVRNPTRISLPTARRQIFGIPNLLGLFYLRAMWTIITIGVLLHCRRLLREGGFVSQYCGRPGYVGVQ